ncbi:MAG: lipopolysaccharide assembly protein LapA domain-containing protein [Desulfitobacterium hafniense]|nr:lipopolysaccharide assembly protein LapA domain-containing protein [Desulfitobacterium hafniense]
MVILIISLLFALLISIFALQNAAPVTIKFFWLLTEVPLVLVILGAALAGALIVFLLAIWREFRLRHKESSIETIPKPETKTGWESDTDQKSPDN